MPTIHTSSRFERQYAKLPPQARRAIRRALRYFDQPSRTCALARYAGLYELRAGLWRVTWHYSEDGAIVLRAVGRHDILAKP